MIVLSGVLTVVEPGVERGGLARAGRAGDQDRAVGRRAARPRSARGRARPCRARRGPSPPCSLSRMRMTTDSPRTTGRVATRRSTWRPSTVSPMRPSCGTRCSAMSRSAMIFTRETRPAHQLARHGRGVEDHAVDAVAHAHVDRARLEVDVGGAAAHGVGDDRVDELDDRRLVGLVAQLDDLGGAARPRPRSPRPRRRGARAGRSAPRCPPARRPRGAPRSRWPSRCRRARARWPGRRWPPAACARRGRRSGSSGSGAPWRRRSGSRRPGRPRTAFRST